MTERAEQTFPALLRQTLEDDQVSVSELARRLSKDAGTAAESERRGLQRYLKGEVTPEPEKAAAIAVALGKPEERFVQTARLQVSIQELLAEIKGLVEGLAAELSARDAKLNGARAQSRLVSRLEALEGLVDREGRAVRESLAAILQILERQAVKGNGRSRTGRPASRRKVAK